MMEAKDVHGTMGEKCGTTRLDKVEVDCIVLAVESIDYVAFEGCCSFKLISTLAPFIELVNLSIYFRQYFITIYQQPSLSSAHE